MSPTSHHKNSRSKGKKIAVQRQLKKRRVQAVIIIVIAILGATWLVTSRAATFSVTVEPENGSLAGCAKVVDDASATSSKAVSFGCSTSSGFVHPGILVSKGQLDFVKGKVAAKQEPWNKAFNNIGTTRSYLATKTYTPKPVKEVKCSTSDFEASQPQVGCVDQRRDAEAAYTQALLWYYTGDQAYANNVIKIINAWSSTHTKTWFDQPRMVNGQIVYGNPGDNNNCPSSNPCPMIYASGLLQTAWTAQSMTRAAEIIRYSNAGWQPADIARAETYFKTVYMDALGAGWTATTNWETSVAEAWTNIGIFTNDRAIYDKGIAYWRQEVPRYIYMTSDGAQPLSPFKSLSWVTGSNGIKYPVLTLKTNVSATDIKTSWKSPTSYINGLGKETCRDIGHLFMGYAGISNVAETARIQGTDLWGEQKNRLIAAYELNSSYMNEFVAAGKPANWKPANQWVCPNVFAEGGGSAYMSLEIALNRYSTQGGNAMPQTKKLAEYARPSSQGLHMAWETLTHANNPN